MEIMQYYGNRKGIHTKIKEAEQNKDGPMGPLLQWGTH
jgi:hypothetical protein